MPLKCFLSVHRRFLGKVPACFLAVSASRTQELRKGLSRLSRGAVLALAVVPVLGSEVYPESAFNCTFTRNRLDVVIRMNLDELRKIPRDPASFAAINAILR